MQLHSMMSCMLRTTIASNSADPDALQHYPHNPQSFTPYYKDNTPINPKDASRKKNIVVIMLTEPAMTRPSMMIE